VRIRGRNPQGRYWRRVLPLSLSWCCACCCLCPRCQPFSIQSVPLSPKPNTTTPPPSSLAPPLLLSTPPRPLAAFPTQPDRRAASFPPGRAIPRRFRAIRRGFGAPLGVSRRIGGDRDSRLEVRPPPPPLRSLTLAARCPPRRAGVCPLACPRLLPAPPCLGAMNR